MNITEETTTEDTSNLDIDTGTETGADDNGGDTDGDTETEVKVRKDIVPPQYRKLYQELGGNCGDFIAAELTSLITTGGVDALNTVKAENGVPAGKWGTLNNGQQRMNLSNILRAKFLRGETISIGGKQYNINDLADEFGKFDAEDEEAADKFLSFASMPTTDRNRKSLVRLFVTLPAQATARAKREEEAAAKKAEKAEKAAAKEAEKQAKAEAAAAEGASEGEAKPKRSRKKKGEAVEAAAEAEAAAADEAAGDNAE